MEDAIWLLLTTIIALNNLVNGENCTFYTITESEFTTNSLKVAHETECMEVCTCSYPNIIIWQMTIESNSTTLYKQYCNKMSTQIYIYIYIYIDTVPSQEDLDNVCKVCPTIFNDSASICKTDKSCKIEFSKYIYIYK